MTKSLLPLALLAASLGGAAAYAQNHDGHQHHHHVSPAQEEAAPNAASSYLLGLSSGTSWNPQSWSMPMLMQRAGNWNLMWMGQAFLVSTQQSGPRGGDKVYSANWGMLAATRNLGAGSLMIRGMLSLDPLTVTGKQYPLLFQTGETAKGKAIVDGQHPHDFLMELGIHYARPLARNSLWTVYYAPVGDVALGPVAFPHRASALELPQATLGHHWQDATHIANNVLTTGLVYRSLRIEASGFRGKEPNENRWNIDLGKIDSWASRLSWRPRPNWLAQISTGYLREPETTHKDDVIRRSASLHYTRPVSRDRQWSSSLIWARNWKSLSHYGTNSLLAETLLPVTRKNLLTARLEWSQRDELFEYDHDLAHELYEKTGRRHFGVGALTLGYSRELASAANVHVAAGFNVSAYTLPATIRSFYGTRPVGLNVFLRFRLAKAE